jgi:hypothetical protein
VLREQPSCRAISRTPSPLRAITRISTACSWVNIDGQKAVSFAQVGQIYFGAVGQLCIGGDNQRKATWSTEDPGGRWRVYEVDELVARDKASLDIFWLKDESLADSDNLPPPEVIAQEIVEDLEAALEQFRLIAADLGEAAR